MRSKILVSLSIVAGSFFLYCSEHAVQRIVGESDSGFVKDAKAAQEGGRTFTKLWEGDFNAETPYITVHVAGYREVSLYSMTPTVNGTAAPTCGPDYSVSFAVDTALTSYANFNSFRPNASNPRGIMLPVAGNEMALGHTGVSDTYCTGWKQHVIIAGTP